VTTQKTNERCYLCDTPVHDYHLGPGEKPPADHRTRDHVPPEGLFPPPKPNNSITVPCCFKCNNEHSGFDERLRLVASMPFDRNQVGQRVADERVFGRTLVQGRQMQFAEKVLASMEPVPQYPDLVRVRIEAEEFEQGMIRITKGLLFTLHLGFDYRRSTFTVIPIHPQPFEQQLRRMAMLKKCGEYFERGDSVFQCWRHVDEQNGGGAWMLLFYQCFGFFVFHTNGSEADAWLEAPVSDTQAP
jgi:hypothetical protein